jgi:serine protease
MRTRRLSPLGAFLLAVSLACAVAHADPGRFLVKMRNPPGASARPQLSGVATRAGLKVLEARQLVGGLHLLRVTAGEPAARTLARLRADPEVLYADLDQRRYPQASPDDPLFAGQWYMQDTEPAAVDALDAWTLTTGSNGVVIAELDTGVRFDHPDLRSGSANRLLPGYDMISSVQTGNTGDGPSADTKTALFANCTVGNSSWHGTRVAGILGAITNDSAGIAGMTWSGWVLPVRVLGKCGGYDSDIIAGMAWAAGFPVQGVPNNPYPARIINMSLGAAGTCPQSYQDMIDQLTAAGVLIVVSAGNEGGPVDTPANCAGVAGIAGLRQVGTKVGFSSLGPEIALSAPAGNCVNTASGAPCLFSIETTTNTGTTVPGTNAYTDQYNINVGTSFSAPIVAGIAGLMLAVNGNLNASQLIERLQLGATAPFPAPAALAVCHTPVSQQDLQTSECACTTAVCGAGMANAHGAVLQALRPIAAAKLPVQVVPGVPVALDGSGSAAACGANIISYQWSIVAPANAPPLQNAGRALASIPAPVGSGVYQVMLTVTDNAGRVDSALVVIASHATSSSAPPTAGANACVTAVSYNPTASGNPSGASSGGGGGGGGGALDLLTLGVVTALATLLVLRRYASRSAASSHSRCARR